MLELSFKDKWGDLGFDGSAVLTTYKNNIDKIAEGVNFFDEGGGSQDRFFQQEHGWTSNVSILWIQGYRSVPC